MAAFPTLTARPLRQIPYKPKDNAIKTPPEAGKVMARKRGTADIYTIGPVEYLVFATDLAAIKAFWDTVGTYGNFTFTRQGVNYDVRFVDGISYTEQINGRTAVSFTLETV